MPRNADQAVLQNSLADHCASEVVPNAGYLRGKHMCDVCRLLP